ncbi:hypothetical protein [Leptospira terpstrae]|uniref:Outer membrane protein, TIGR04327 family n=1 Tax=Leptospira terpstrae serovar Hualin str. LT 11-33 = ATCC 700639 TaxID=1257025 RepID=N1VLV7_9LEPT|nr:hypothetical protein [Leptospira terpstrae]EMY60694.1 outer membrane protein, TIGR04327 family [Leptospira terpstrae serovar Hualin str. LT 11-33 = ATCC 700639]
MKVLFQFLVICIFCSSMLGAEEKNTNGNSKKNNFLIRFSEYTYIPSEYYNIRGLSGYNLGEYSDQKPTKYNNRTPQFSFRYHIEKFNLGMEYSFFKLEQSELTTGNIFINPERNSITFNNVAFPNVIRRENKLNITKDFEIGDNQKVWLGIGVRNIYKEIYRRLYTYRDQIKTDTYGLQFLVRYQLQVFENFFWTSSIEPFYTTGRRAENNSPFLRDLNIGIPTGPNEYTYFYGYDFDTNFAYRFSENFSIVLGYNYIRTRVRSQFADRGLYYLPETNSIFTLPRNREGTDDNLFNYYMGIRGEF